MNSTPQSTVSPLGFIHQFVPGQPGAPVLLLLHGTGGNEHDLLELGSSLLPGAALLSPRGRILENGMPRFFRRLAEGIFDMEDLVFRTHELADFVEAAGAHYRFDAGRVIAVGYSNGANVAASVLLLRPGTFSGAVLLRSMLPLTPDPVPDLSGLPVFMASGRTDPIMSAQNAEDLAALLRQAGADVTLQWSPAGHQPTAAEIDEARRWLGARV
jgi:predicted esterase